LKELEALGQRAPVREAAGESDREKAPGAEAVSDRAPAVDQERIIRRP